ncbi:MAG: exported protein of unknown function [Clostridiales bacterium]|jgi:NitT/TauT family transport system substrate-binding protein|nr:exported protein of unknown function [Clostridiales bacterium]
MKKILSILLAVILATTLLAGCGSKKTTDEKTPANGEKTKVVVSEFRALGWLPVHVAYQNGYFDEEGLDLEFAVYGDGPVAFQGMHAGDSQFCLLSVEPVLRAYEEGLESTFVAAVQNTRLYAFVGAKDITDVKQLKGKSIFAGAPGSSPYSFVSNILKNAGLNPETDVTFVNMQYGASMVALSQGTIAASYMNVDNRIEFEKIDGNVLVDTADLETRKEIFGSELFEGEIITTTKKFAEENPETVQKFVNAVVKGNKWIQEHSDKEAAELVAPLFEGNPVDTLTKKINIFKQAYSSDGMISKEGYAAVEKFAIGVGIIKEPIGYENIVDMTFVEKANQGK